MLKKILSLITVAAVAFEAGAATGTMDYTYADGELFAYCPGTTPRVQTVNVAIRLDDPILAGTKITGIRAYVHPTSGISGTSLWLSKELEVDNKVNIPDIASYNATVAPVTVGDQTLGLLSTKLAEPYEITTEPLFVGYTMTLDNVADDATRNPVILSRGVTSDGFWIYASQSILKWQDYSEKAGGVAFIVVEVEGDFTLNSVSVSGNEDIYAEDGEPYQAVFNVMNEGLQPVTSLKYTYSYDGGEALEGSVDIAQPIEPSLSLTSPVTLDFGSVSGVGPHRLDLTVTEVNGMPNEASDPTYSAITNVIPFKPVHRPLVEEYTGLWCGWCPGGWLAMEMIAERFGDEAVGISYHDNDVLTVEPHFAVEIKEFPSSTIDRGMIVDPYFGSYENKMQFGIADDIEVAMGQLAIASIDVTAQMEGSDKVKALASVRFIKDIDEADYQVGYVLIANGLSSPNWYQTNYYYNRGDDYKGTPLEVLTTMPSRIPGLVFNDVAVETGAMMGVAGSLPSKIITDREYSHEYTFDISDNKILNNKDVQTLPFPDMLTVSAFVIDRKTGAVVNSSKINLSDSFVDRIEDDGSSRQLTEREFFDLSGRRIQHPTSGIYLRISRFSDGSSTTDKIIIH